MAKDDAPVIRMVDPATLTPYAKNAKCHSPKQIEKLAAMISAYGFDQPIVVDRNNVIVKGHGRREAALKLKMAEVPVIVSDLDEYEIAANRLADNKSASTDYDAEALRHELGALKDGGFDMNLTGFDAGEVERLCGGLKNAAADAVKAAPMPSLTSVAAAGRPAPALPDDAEAEEVGLRPEAASPPRAFLAFGQFKVPMLQEELDALDARYVAHTEENGTHFGFIAQLLA